ncbi:LAFE_0A01222g1_1 [Lachancea fermentati]|uniref:alpha-1,2-Mannosidase n=1 Tax=Lachancea fermentati TaxID=4955 RepID=A0A1G4M6B6_LACFM|nr:LAFE_0A01222g1_1 [Lachancea fermentati]
MKKGPSEKGFFFKAFIGLLTAFSAYLLYSTFQESTTSASPSDLRDQIETVFLDSWNDYKTYAWGYDVYHPLSHQKSNMYGSNGKPLGWIIVDALDTIMLMYNSTQTHKQEFANEIQLVETWINDVLDYDIDVSVSIFETTIRMLGGLLSGYYLSKELQVGNPDIYLNKAIDLADRLLPAFDATSTGIPYSSINLHTGESVKNHVDDGASSTAEFTTLQLEFKYLSAITGDPAYWEAAEAVYTPLYEENDLLHTFHGLVPIYVYPDNAKFHGQNIRLGSRGDSFYEYLLKQYLQTHEPVYYKLYRQSMEGMKQFLLAKSEPSGLVFIGEREHGLYGPLSPKMDHLVCFMGGLLAMGATEGLQISKAREQPFWDTKHEEDWNLAKSLTRTCYEMYHQVPSGLASEIVVFNKGNSFRPNYWKSSKGDFFIKPADTHNLQRPETVESIMFLYHLTKDQKYRDWGREIFQSFRIHTSVNCQGPNKNCVFTSLSDVISKPTKKGDNLESFWLAETLKYLYLLFLDDVDLSSVVFNTEAHPFPVLPGELLTQKKLFTGWSI